MNFKFKLIFFLSLVTMISCKENQQKETNQSKSKVDNPDKYKQDLENANKIYQQNEAFQMDDYAKRNGWNMKQTNSGVRYLIYQQGQGRKIENELIVRFNFRVNLLNEVICYDSKIEGPKEIRMGHADVVSGLEEALLLMRVGDKAKVIIPSHLAYGWIGDSDKIPTRAVLIYDVEILKVRNFNKN